MKGRDKLFFNLLTFLLVVAIGLVGWQTKQADDQIKKWKSDIKRRQERGVEDPQLRETVDRLETDLRARLAESFAVERDPLSLIEVIKTRKFLKQFGILESAESETRMRLSCTVTGDSGTSAIVKYRGRSWMLNVGDKLAEPAHDGAPAFDSGYRVESIGTNRVVLARGGERMTLVTEKAPDTIAEEEKMFGNSGERKPVVEVKQVQAGNY